MLKYVLFDVDGTLTDPSEGIIRAVLFALPRMGIRPPEDPNELNALIGPPMLDCMQHFFNLTPESARKLLDIYREYYSEKGLFEATVYDGIPELLDTLRAHGMTLHTATSKPLEYVERLFNHFGLRDRFTFLGADDLACTRHTKAEVIKYVFENVPDITPENTVMVGDRKFDILAAHAFGLRAIGCAWGHAPAGELEEAGADYIAATPTEAGEILKSL